MKFTRIMYSIINKYLDNKPINTDRKIFAALILSGVRIN